MCGIYGAAVFSQELSKTKMAKIRDLINQLSILNMERGQDSTGIARVDCSPSPTILLYKDIGPAHHVMLDSEWDKTCRLNNNTFAMLGHTRAATHGIICKENAHPFLQENILGVHNGIIFDILSEERFKKLKVDSRAAIQCINDGGLEQLSQFSGSGAFAFFDARKPNSLFLYRDRNPCYIFVSKDNYLIFSSQEDHLLRAIGNIKDGEYIFEVPENRKIEITRDHKIVIDTAYLHLLPVLYTREQKPRDTMYEQFYETDILDFKGIKPKNTSQVDQEKEKTILNTLASILRIELKILLNDSDSFLKTKLFTAMELPEKAMFCKICLEEPISPNDIYHYIEKYKIFLCEDCMETIVDKVIDEQTNTMPNYTSNEGI